MAHLTVDDLARRARLQAFIDRKDAERGRPLTEAEQAANLWWHQTHCFKCQGEVSWDAEKCKHCGEELV